MERLKGRMHMAGIEGVTVHEPRPSAGKDRMQDVLIGCAGWSVPGAMAEHFPIDGSHLERYARVLPAVEINTSFYRPHRPATYARWRDSVPDAFRFSVKVPKKITHELRLQNAEEPLVQFIGEASNLQHKLACLLVQLPPSLRYDASTAIPFFDRLRSLTSVAVVCEPRHVSWFDEHAAGMLQAHEVGYVIADPPAVARPVPELGTETVYIRLHGSPVMYHSAYSQEYLQRLSADIEEKRHAGRRIWCIFDNTASGAAMPDALSLLGRFAGTTHADEAKDATQ
jgi:uncharacterized protein YecE (DUF72 family)